MSDKSGALRHEHCPKETNFKTTGEWHEAMKDFGKRLPAAYRVLQSRPLAELFSLSDASPTSAVYDVSLHHLSTTSRRLEITLTGK